MSFFAIYPALGSGSGSGGITSINGDTTAAQVIAAGSGITVGTVSGTTTISATGGSGTVTSVSVTTANGVSGSVATATTTPAISLTLGAITPSSIVASGAISGSNLSGTNTGDQTITLTGDVTGSGVGSFAATIANSAVTNAKIANATIDLTTKVTGTLPVGNGGTNSATALSNGRVMVSSGGAIVEQAAITANRAVASSASGLPVASATTDTELGFVSGVTSAIQTQLNAKQATGNYVTALTGDVTATGPGSVAATIANLAVTNAKIANSTIDLTTKVTGALPIANGGTGQVTANPAFNALSPLTTKGDLVAFSTVNARLPVGSDGQTLVADSGQTLGVKWASGSPTTSRYFVGVGSGSAGTNTAIARFTTVFDSAGTDITYTPDALLGDSFTINTDGVYAMMHTNIFTAVATVGISKDSTQLSTGIESITDADALVMNVGTGSDNAVTCAVTLYLPNGSVIRPHCAASFVNSADFHRAKFTIQRVS